MTWLIILQFFTIAFAYIISEKYIGGSSERLDNVDRKYGKGCINFIVIGGIIAIILKLFSDNYKSNHPLDNKQNLSYQIDSVGDFNNVKQNDSNSDYPIGDSINYDKLQLSDSLSMPTDMNPMLTIRQFISAENNRDFSMMSSYLSFPMIRFWNKKNQYYGDVEGVYNKTWTSYNYTNTEIIDITKLSDGYYLVKAHYHYDEKGKDTKIFFLINREGKIYSIY